MQTLIVYDNSGTIYFQAAGNVTQPIGIPFIVVDVPPGKLAISVDVSGETHVPVLVDLPKTQVEIELEQVKQDNEMLKGLVAELGLMVGGGL